MADINVMTLFDSLAAFGGTVKGIQNSFKLSETPDKLVYPSQLPALVIYPGIAQGDEFHFQTFVANAPHLSFSVVHQLYFAPSNSTQYKAVLPLMMKFLMDYASQAAIQRFLDTRDTNDGSRPWQVPLNFKSIIGPDFKFSDIPYHGIQFNYNFDIQL